MLLRILTKKLRHLWPQVYLLQYPGAPDEQTQVPDTVNSYWRGVWQSAVRANEGGSNVPDQACPDIEF